MGAGTPSKPDNLRTNREKKKKNRKAHRAEKGKLIISKKGRGKRNRGKKLNSKKEKRSFLAGSNKEKNIEFEGN